MCAPCVVCSVRADKPTDVVVGLQEQRSRDVAVQVDRQARRVQRTGTVVEIENHAIGVSTHADQLAENQRHRAPSVGLGRRGEGRRR